MRLAARACLPSTRIRQPASNRRSLLALGPNNSAGWLSCAAGDEEDAEIQRQIDLEAQRRQQTGSDDEGEPPSQWLPNCQLPWPAAWPAGVGLPNRVHLATSLGCQPVFLAALQARPAHPCMLPSPAPAEEQPGAGGEEEGEEGEGSPAPRGGGGSGRRGKAAALETGLGVDEAALACEVAITVPLDCPKLLMREIVEKVAAETIMRGVPGRRSSTGAASGQRACVARGGAAGPTLAQHAQPGYRVGARLGAAQRASNNRPRWPGRRAPVLIALPCWLCRPPPRRREQVVHAGGRARGGSDPADRRHQHPRRVAPPGAPLLPPLLHGLMAASGCACPACMAPPMRCSLARALLR